MNDDVLTWDISKMGLSCRAYNTLWRSGHTTVGDVYKLNPREIYEARDLGYKTRQELICNMKILGFVDWADITSRYNHPKRPKRRDS